MSEINGPKFSVNQVSYSGIQKQSQEVSNEQPEVEHTKINDFSDPKAEALGRSMLFKGTDDTNHDLKVLLDNPQIAENSDEIFEQAYNVAKDNGLENPYEEAASIATVSI